METLLAYFTTFQATVEEAEQVLSLLPHVAGSPAWTLRRQTRAKTIKRAIHNPQPWDPYRPNGPYQGPILLTLELCDGSGWPCQLEVTSQHAPIGQVGHSDDMPNNGLQSCGRLSKL